MGTIGQMANSGVILSLTVRSGCAAISRSISSCLGESGSSMPLAGKESRSKQGMEVEGEKDDRRRVKNVESRSECRIDDTNFEDDCLDDVEEEEEEEDVEEEEGRRS